MKKILVIEDNNEIRENISEILELDGYDVVQAANGKDGVTKTLNMQPDLILCDIMMPELDGYGVLHILSKKESTASIPFIFLTAKAEKADMRKGMILGADDYLIKPFDDNELLDAIETRFKKSEVLKKSYGGTQNSLNEFINDTESQYGIKHLIENRKSRVYKKKNEVYREGDYPNHIYYLIRGRVKMIKVNEEGKELITSICTAGNFFGYESLLKNSDHGDSAETIEESEIIAIPKQDFFKLLYYNKEVSKKFISLLSNKVVEEEQKLLDLAYNSVRQRTAGALISLHEKFQSDGNDGLTIHLSRDDLSNLVGTATESVIRALSDLRQEGIVETLAGKIIIKDLQKLKEIEKWHVIR
ncbi:MAG: response regulator [Bacteroidota bacterium]